MTLALRGLGGLTIVCGDFNSHHTLWVSERSNDRGRLVADFIASTSLNILNRGSTPTFYTLRDDTLHTSCIDLSLVSTWLLPLVSQWEVKDDITTSDHRLIVVKIDLQPECTKQSTRRFATKRAKWNLFCENVVDRSNIWRDWMRNATGKDNVETLASRLM